MIVDPYVRDKQRQLVSFMNRLSQRQRDIRKEMSMVDDQNQKYILDNERTTNTVVLRIATWVKMTLEGRSFEDKLLIDKKFPEWMRHIKGFYIWDYLAELWGVDDDINKSGYSWSPWHRRYYNQEQLYYYIWTGLFPDKPHGVFGFTLDNSVEEDIWKDTFKGLLEKEWKQFKELRGY